MQKSKLMMSTLLLTALYLMQFSLPLSAKASTDAPAPALAGAVDQDYKETMYQTKLRIKNAIAKKNATVVQKELHQLTSADLNYLMTLKGDLHEEENLLDKTIRHWLESSERSGHAIVRIINAFIKAGAVLPENIAEEVLLSRNHSEPHRYQDPSGSLWYVAIETGSYSIIKEIFKRPKIKEHVINMIIANFPSKAISGNIEFVANVLIIFSDSSNPENQEITKRLLKTRTGIYHNIGSSLMEEVDLVLDDARMASDNDECYCLCYPTLMLCNASESREHLSRLKIVSAALNLAHRRKLHDKADIYKRIVNAAE
jgi:hypothetical protein